MRTHRPITTILILALFVVLASGVTPTAGIAAQSAPPSIDWTKCHRNLGFKFECARVSVPLDYSHPNGAQISLAMVRLPAKDQAHKIGSLFINPGGPGGSGVDFALGAAPYLYGGAIQDRFDIVGWDPRGIIRSTPLRCFDSQSQWGPAFTPFAFPLTHKQERRWRKADLYLVRACRDRAGPILDHMATADDARDLDRLRAAVGDDQLTYFGVSYGSFLGVTYANMFPDRVRAVIVDGVLDPIAWTTGVDGERYTIPFSTRLRSDMGAQATLDQFFALCDAGRRCAFAPHAAARYARLAKHLRNVSVAVAMPDGQRFHFTYQDLIGNTLGAMYSSTSWPSFAKFLKHVEQRVGAPRLGLDLADLHRAEGVPAGYGYKNFLEGFPGVACTDSDNPSEYQAWHEQGAIADERYGYFGRIWTWISSVCARWQGFDQERYMGPFDHRTANPVLVIGNLWDPATRYQGAQIVHSLLPNSAFLTVHGWGHTSLFMSRCADRVSVAYLTDLRTPKPGKICDQDNVPFHAPGASRLAAEHRASVMPYLMPWALRRTLTR
jgi:pimeloyl-ACP methyl ester carboxylesterase